MTNAEDVRKLAALSRIDIAEGDLVRFTKEFDAILEYVGQLESLDLPKAEAVKPPLRNSMREDGEPHASGAYTEKLAAQFPERDGDLLKVKQIISHE